MIILSDTREKNPWKFEFYEDCEVIKQKLPYGDYTIQGLEDIVCIERKMSTGEIWGNLCTKEGSRRFNNEMSKLKDSVEFFYILLEFPEFHMSSFPENSKIPGRVRDKSKGRLNSKFLKRKMYELIEEYGVRVIYGDTRSKAEDIAYKILKGKYERFRGSS